MRVLKSAPAIQRNVRLSVGIVAFNDSDEVVRAIGALRAALADVHHEISVVDNSTPPLSDLPDRLRDVRILSGHGNIGFSRAMNLALCEATGSDVLILNSDVEFEPEALQALLEARELASWALLGPSALDDKGRETATGAGSRPSPASALALLFGIGGLRGRICKWGKPFRSETRVLRKVDFLTGMCCLAPINLWRALGGYDEQFFFSGEDADLAVRALRASAPSYIVEAARVRHARGRVERRDIAKAAMIVDGVERYTRKHLGYAAFAAATVAMRLWLLRRWIIAQQLKRFPAARTSKKLSRQNETRERIKSVLQNRSGHYGF